MNRTPHNLNLIQKAVLKAEELTKSVIKGFDNLFNGAKEKYTNDIQNTVAGTPVVQANLTEENMEKKFAANKITPGLKEESALAKVNLPGHLNDKELSDTDSDQIDEIHGTGEALGTPTTMKPIIFRNPNKKAEPKIQKSA